MNEPILTVVGNLVADPEPRVSQAGRSWCTFRVASTPRVKDKQSGEYADGEALWLGCRAYADLADHIVSSLTKGTRVIMQGRLTQNSYTDNTGAQRTGLNFEVDSIGPELRFATAQVHRNEARGTGTYQHGAQGGSNATSGAGMGSWAQPVTNGAQTGVQDGAAQMDGYYDQGGTFDDEQPF